MKKISIYQLPIRHKAKYMGLEFVKEQGIMPTLSEYKKVYEGEVEDNTSLDDIYQMLNVGARPEGFTGHSLSCSDVIEIAGDYFYCDSYGWEQVNFGTEPIFTYKLYSGNLEVHLNIGTTFYGVTREHATSVSLGICLGMRAKYKHPRVDLYEVTATGSQLIHRQR